MDSHHNKENEDENNYDIKDDIVYLYNKFAKLDKLIVEFNFMQKLMALTIFILGMTYLFTIYKCQYTC